MALDLANTMTHDLGSERKLKMRIRVRLIQPQEREAFDAILAKEHYLHNPTAVGAVLRYVVTEDDHWLALLVFCSPALHLKPRDQWLEWIPAEVPQRRRMRWRSSFLNNTAGEREQPVPYPCTRIALCVGLGP